MFNVVINNEQYDEYLAQKEKIRELEARNNFLKDQYQQVVSEKVALIKECDRLTNVVHKQGSYIISLRAKNNDLNEQNKTIVNQDKMIETLQAKIADYDNKGIRFKEIVTENYRLRMSINDLKANNKDLNAEKEALMWECNRLDNELESIKGKSKEPVASITINPCRDSKEAYSPDNNTVIKIENLYITNNYFSEEDKDDE